MKSFISKILICFCIFLGPPTTPARADLFGGDVAVLMQILANAVQQLAQLQSILKNGKDSLQLLEEINQGINDSLQLAETFGIRMDPGLYRELQKVDQAAGALETVFGRAVDSPLATIQRNTDQTVAESIAFNNELNDYALKLDQIGERIKSFSHQVSPGGAAKLTAESLGVLIHVMNQQIRATGQGLKLQAQSIAIQNKHEKDRTAQYLKEGKNLSVKMTSINPSFEAPRF